MIWLRLLPFIIAAAAIGVALWFWGDAIAYKAEADKYKTALATAEEVNKHNAVQINKLKNDLEFTDALAVSLMDRLEEANSALAEKTEELQKLEETSPDVKAFLDSPLPADLERLLNHETGSPSQN